MPACKRNRSVLGGVLLAEVSLALASAQAGNEHGPASKNGQPSARELFKLLSPSVFVIETLDVKGVAIAPGSGVSTAKDSIVTNKHVVEGGNSWRVRQGDNTWSARIAFVDSEHDLCGLQVSGLNATPEEQKKLGVMEVYRHLRTLDQNYADRFFQQYVQPGLDSPNE